MNLHNSFERLTNIHIKTILKSNDSFYIEARRRKNKCEVLSFEIDPEQKQKNLPKFQLKIDSDWIKACNRTHSFSGQFQFEASLLDLTDDDCYGKQLFIPLIGTDTNVTVSA